MKHNEDKKKNSIVTYNYNKMPYSYIRNKNHSGHFYNIFQTLSTDIKHSENKRAAHRRLAIAIIIFYTLTVRRCEIDA